MPGAPDFVEEESLWAQGYRLIAGIDEVGRGALAGPVAAAAVALPEKLAAPWSALVRDSKQLTPTRRESLSQEIMRQGLGIGIGTASVEMIESQGILAATRWAMAQAVARLTCPPDFLLIDHIRLPALSLPQRGITDGDSRCFSIACASIVAKVYRDRLMVELDQVYPGYGFSEHKGYGTRQHLSCLHRLGPCPVHRRGFAPVREILQWGG